MSGLTSGSDASHKAPSSQNKSGFFSKFALVTVLLICLLAVRSCRDSTGDAMFKKIVNKGSTILTFDSTPIDLTEAGLELTLAPGSEVVINKGKFYYDYTSKDSIQITVVSHNKERLGVFVEKESGSVAKFPKHKYLICKNVRTDTVRLKFFNISLIK